MKITGCKSDGCIIYVITDVTSGVTRLEGKKAVGWGQKSIHKSGLVIRRTVDDKMNR